MSWVRVFVHVVFTTKVRQPLLTKDIRSRVFNHISENAKDKKIIIDSIGGYTDHVHCLISLNREISISKTMQLIKGESSYWINKNKLTKQKFAYQDDYWMVGVSESHVKSVRRYIQNQEQHHAKTTFDVEIESFMSKNIWTWVKD